MQPGFHNLTHMPNSSHPRYTQVGYIERSPMLHLFFSTILLRSVGGWHNVAEQYSGTGFGCHAAGCEF